MRLFVAIDLPDDARGALAGTIEALPRDLPKARWARPEAMHLTLAFLGEVDDEAVGSIGPSLDQAAASRPSMSAVLRGAGAFPPRGKARVLWTGFAADGDLEGLHRSVESALAELPGPTGPDGAREPLYVPEHRPFRPHVTLARCRSPWPRPAVTRFVGAFDAALASRPLPSVQVDEIVLVESVLLPTGPRYRRVSSHALGGTDGGDAK